MRREPPASRGPLPTLVRWLGIGLAAAAAFGLARVAGSGGGAAGDHESIDRAVDEVLVAEGVDRDAVRARAAGPPPGASEASPATPAELRVPVPDGEPFATMNADLARAVSRAGGEVLDVVEEGRLPERPDSIEMLLGRDGAATHRVRLVRESDAGAPADGEAVIALVFDDLGYTTEGLARELLDLPAPVTFAVLPGLRHSAEFADSARARGHDVLLHLPMEPLDRVRHDPGGAALSVSLAPEENLARLRAALDGLPAYDGVSNHMGSRYTAWPEGMSLVLDEIRGRGGDLFWLDSRTTPYSVAAERARAAGVPCLVNNLFLDGADEHAADPAVQAERLGRLALRRGRAIAIGHVRPETVAAVRDAIPAWRAAGIRLVGITDLMHRGAGATRVARTAKGG